MKIKKFTLSLIVIGTTTILTACNGNKQEEQTKEEVTVHEDPSTTIADQINLLEAESNALIKQMEQKADIWCYEHPDIPDDAEFLSDSLNAINVKERARLREIENQIDSLKNL